MNQRKLTTAFIIVGGLFALLNFYIFNQMNGGLQFNLDLARSKGDVKATALLPDINPGDSYTKSKLRDSEIKKIKNSLPYSDSRMSIVYDETTKYLTATLNGKTIAEYRENKFIAEEKLFELGAQEPCLLQVIWAVPVPLKNQVPKFDLVTRGCAN